MTLMDRDRCTLGCGMGARASRAAVVLGITLLLALAASTSAPASTKAIPPKQWTTNFCGSIGSWITQIRARTAIYNTSIAAWRKTGNGKISKIRGILVVYVGDTSKLTDTMISKVKDAGPPAVTNGAKTQAQVNAALGQVAAIFHKALTRAKALPKSNAILFARQAASLAATIDSGVAAIGPAFAAIGKSAAPALTRAGRTTRACQTLG